MLTSPTAREYLTANQWQGFDTLARNLNRKGLDCTKDDVKQLWNHMGLGFKYVPRTEVDVHTEILYKQRGFFLARWFFGKYYVALQYVLDSDIIIFVDPITPRVIPKGMSTDFGSIPTFLHWILDKDNPHFLVAFINHDLDYILQWNDRVIADARLRFFARNLGAGIIIRNLVYIAVRIGGYFPWRRVTAFRSNNRKRLIDLVDEATSTYRDKTGAVLSAIAKKYV